jgi:hypothetical protein
VEENPEKLKYINPKTIRGLDERALYWFPRERIKNILFLLKQKPQGLKDYKFSKNFTEKDYLQQVLKKLWSHNMDAFFSDITLPKFKKIGYVVVKVVVPQLTPFYLNEEVPYFGGKRLYEVPYLLGLAAKQTNEDMLNSIPHPFL